MTKLQLNKTKTLLQRYERELDDTQYCLIAEVRILIKDIDKELQGGLAESGIAPVC